MRAIALSLVLAITSFSISSCSRDERLSAIPVSSEHSSRLSIVNGIVTEAYPAVFEFDGGCTASAVSSNTAISAGHCMRRGLPSKNGVRATAMKVRHWADGIDLAVVVFPAETFTDYIEVTDRAPTVDDSLLIVGYGHTAYPPQGRRDGQKRYGSNRLFGFVNWTDMRGTITFFADRGNYLHYRAPITVTNQAVGTEVISSNGDSGGPLLIDGKLVGVTSDGDLYPRIARLGTLVDDPSPDATKQYEFDSNLFSADAIALMDEAEANISASVSGLAALKAAFDAPR